METKTEQREWEVRWDHSDKQLAEALICERLPNCSSSMVYGIAEVTNVPCDVDEDGDPFLIREGEDSERLRDVCLIVHAPDMLKAIRDAIEALEAVTGLHKPDAKCGTWIVGKGHETEVVWSKLVRIQDQLQRTEHNATDLDTV